MKYIIKGLYYLILGIVGLIGALILLLAFSDGMPPLPKQLAHIKDKDNTYIIYQEYSFPDSGGYSIYKFDNNIDIKDYERLEHTEKAQKIYHYQDRSIDTPILKIKNNYLQLIGNGKVLKEYDISTPKK